MRRTILPALASALAIPFLLGGSCSGGGSGGGNEDGNGNGGQGQIVLPAQDDFVDRGVAVGPGAPGSWDVRLEGAISPVGVVKHQGTWFLYYIAADGDRSSDGGPRRRRLGVATSTDGVNFAPFPGNPILEFLPNDNEEEGVFSGAVVHDGGGQVLVWYGGLDAGSPTSPSVTDDVRLATSNDGFAFADQGIVVDHGDGGVFGSGDELHPIGAYREGGTWNVYYLANNGALFFALGVASGTSPGSLPNTRQALPPEIVGGGDVIPDGEGGAFLFLVREFGARDLEVYAFDPAAPEVLGAPLVVYDLPGFLHGTILLDEDTETWFLYALTTGDVIRVYTAPLERS